MADNKAEEAGVPPPYQQPQQPYPQQPQQPYPQQPQQPYPQQPQQPYPQQPQQPYPQQQGYPQQPPPSYGGAPYQSQQTTTTTVVTAQPQTVYTVPQQRRSNEGLPAAGLVFSIIMLSVCLGFGNLLALACLVPAIIFAILGLSAASNDTEAASNYGKISIGLNIFNLAFWIIGFIVMVICLVVIL